MPFEGYAQSFLDESGKVKYTGGMTFEEYQKDRGGDLMLISWEEFDKLHTDFYKTAFSEITEEFWDMCLNQLPPLKWHWINARFNVFYCSEPYSGSFHSCYIFDKKTGKYYSGRKCIFLTDSQLLEEIQNEILKTNK